MGVLRFLRPVRSAAAALQTSGHGEAPGLDAFATEVPDRATAVGGVGVKTFSPVLIGLLIVVVLQSVPTALWIQSRFAPAAPAAEPAATAVSSAIPPAAAAAAPCTSASQLVSATGTAGAPARPDDTGKTQAARVASPGLVAGLLAVTAPVPMRVFAGGRLVGTTESDTIMLPVGEHDLELVSDSVGLRAKRTVTVQAGRTSTLRIDPPRVPVHINAIPWAEVWIDNQRIGETPIGNLQQPIGSHEFVFRHPELGERRMVVMITMQEPARISMDLRKR